MLAQMSLPVQRAWLSRAIAMLQPNDQMFAPEPLAIVQTLTQAACQDPGTEHTHVADLARYWTHGLRFSEHSAMALNRIEELLAQEHARTMVETEIDALLNAETQAPRMLRLWSLLKDTLPAKLLHPHLERVLAEPLPIGKKRKLSHIDPDQWTSWLPQERQLTPEAFHMGIFLYTLTNLTSRQEVSIKTRCANAWAMLLACENHLSQALKTYQREPTVLAAPLRALVEHADSETIANMPWPAIQNHYSNEPEQMRLVWEHLFFHHKTMLLQMLPTIQTKYHDEIRQRFMALETYPLEQERAEPLLRLIAHDTKWSIVLDKMLKEKTNRRKLGDYFLSLWSHPKGPKSTNHLPSAMMQAWTTTQWEDMLKLGRPEHVNFEQLCGMWQLVGEHNLHHLANSPVLQKITLHILQHDLIVPAKVRPWDTNLAFVPFYQQLLHLYLPVEDHLPWFHEWTKSPNSEALVVQAFGWFNPTIAVPPLNELKLLSQTMGGPILDILHHLKKTNGQTQSFDLPSMSQ